MHLALLLFLALFVAQADEGVGIDPNGGVTISGDHRCTIDPNGGPCVGALGGGAMDPNGKATASTNEWPWQGGW